MSELGEGSAATTIEDVVAETGTLKVSVRDICTGKRVPEATISVGINTQTGDDQGEAVFSDLSVGSASIKVKKHFKDADYLTFLVHKLPFSKTSITRSWEAKSSEQDVAIISKDKETRARIEIPVYRVEDGVRFCRKDLKYYGGLNISYGHWWIEIGDKSYGWWPEEGQLQGKDLPPPEKPAPLPTDAGITAKISHMAYSAGYFAHMARYQLNRSGQAFYKTFTGVPGVLNGNEYQKRIEEDPYHQKWKEGETDEDYHPVIVDCRTEEDIRNAIRNFALAYSGDWSWVFEFGNNCHTFQTRAMSELDLEKVKQL